MYYGRDKLIDYSLRKNTYLKTFLPKQDFPNYFMFHVSLAIQMKLLRVMTWPRMIQAT